ncbi:MAG: translation initiation factor IF-3 [Proteobacteria bacterium]|nr:translation initiation factor IF-3 [Pseudomonadota bacterium]NBP14942.1 translation initiation factor IF-3 [bacterium]
MKKGQNSQPRTGSPKQVSGPLANEEIRAEKVQVITQDGANYGVVDRRTALNLAFEVGLDLVLIAETGSEGVPVTKIMDFGKELYNRKKKQNEAKKHQKVIQIKEIKIRPKIGEHDYITKMNQGIGFLEDGKKLKVTLVFRGREMANKEERGRELFSKIDRTFEERGLLERIIEDKDVKIGSAWSKLFSLKNS